MSTVAPFDLSDKISSIFQMCLFQVSALCCAGGEQNLILLDRTTHKPNPAGTVGWAGSTFGPLHKSRVGEHEFEALMRTLDNLVGPVNASTIKVYRKCFLVVC